MNPGVFHRYGEPAPSAVLSFPDWSAPDPPARGETPADISRGGEALTKDVGAGLPDEQRITGLLTADLRDPCPFWTVQSSPG